MIMVRIVIVVVMVPVLVSRLRFLLLLFLIGGHRSALGRRMVPGRLHGLGLFAGVLGRRLGGDGG